MGRTSKEDHAGSRRRSSKIGLASSHHRHHTPSHHATSATSPTAAVLEEPGEQRGTEQQTEAEELMAETRHAKTTRKAAGTRLAARGASEARDSREATEDGHASRSGSDGLSEHHTTTATGNVDGPRGESDLSDLSEAEQGSESEGEGGQGEEERRTTSVSLGLARERARRRVPTTLPPLPPPSRELAVAIEGAVARVAKADGGSSMHLLRHRFSEETLLALGIHLQEIVAELLTPQPWPPVFDMFAHERRVTMRRDTAERTRDPHKVALTSRPCPDAGWKFELSKPSKRPRTSRAISDGAAAAATGGADTAATSHGAQRGELGDALTANAAAASASAAQEGVRSLRGLEDGGLGPFATAASSPMAGSVADGGSDWMGDGVQLPASSRVTSEDGGDGDAEDDVDMSEAETSDESTASREAGNGKEGEDSDDGHLRTPEAEDDPLDLGEGLYEAQDVLYGTVVAAAGNFAAAGADAGKEADILSDAGEDELSEVENGNFDSESEPDDTLAAEGRTAGGNVSDSASDGSEAAAEWVADSEGDSDAF